MHLVQLGRLVAVGQEAVGLVDQHHRVVAAGLLEQTLDIPLRLAHPLAPQRPRLHHPQRPLELGGNRVRAQGLTRSRRPHQQRHHALAVGHVRADAPALQHQIAMPRRAHHLVHLRPRRLGQHHIAKPHLGIHQLVALQTRPMQLVAHRPLEHRLVNHGLVWQRMHRVGHRHQHRVLDVTARQLKAIRQRHQVHIARQRHRGRQVVAPNGGARSGIRLAKLDLDQDPPVQRFVEHLRQVGGQHRHAFKAFELRK